METGDPNPKRFERGPDRRRQQIPVDVERRRGSRDRRGDDQAWMARFRNVDEATLLAAIADSEVLAMQPGQTLLSKGQANDNVYLVLSGELGVHIADGDTLDSVIAISPGECLGELSAIDHQAVSATVKARTPSRVLKLSQDVFWNRLMAVPGVARDLMTILSQRMRRSTESIIQGHRRQIELDYLRQELDVARQLQLGMLPLNQPMFPDRPEIEIVGVMEAAASVGGDLFDAFFVGEQRLFFCIGDVSGHGIPAALFMARAVSLMRIAAFGAPSPAELLERINQDLCTGNDANLFLTLFCGFLDVDTGRLEYANAGHLPPVHYRDGLSSSLPLPKGTILGVLPGIRYTHREIVLAENDFILCFTDGVTEAQTPSGEEFSETRLISLVERMAHHPLDLVLQQVRADITEFSGDSSLDDDCTMLAIRRPTFPAA